MMNISKKAQRPIHCSAAQNSEHSWLVHMSVVLNDIDGTLLFSTNLLHGVGGLSGSPLPEAPTKSLLLAFATLAATTTYG